MSLDQRARDAGVDVRDQVATIEPPTPDVIARRSRRGRMATGLAAVAVLALAGVGLAVALQDDSASTGLKVTDDPDPTTAVPPARTGGWHRGTSVATSISSGRAKRPPCPGGSRIGHDPGCARRGRRTAGGCCSGV